MIFNRRQCFNMQFRAMCFNPAEKVFVKGYIVLWKHPADYVNFRHRLIIICLNHIQHILHRVFPAIFPVLDQPGIGAKSTSVDAHIGWFNMKISVEEGFIALFLLPDKVCQ